VYASSHILTLLEDGKLDAAIAADYPGLELRHSAAIMHRAIATEPIFVALPDEHRLQDRLEVRLSYLAHETWFLTPDDGAGWPDVFYTACRTAGFTPSTVHEYLGDRRTLRHMICEGLGIAAVQASLRPGDGVTVKPLAETPLWCRYVLAWRVGAVPEVVVEALFAAASSAHRDLIAESAVFRAWASRTYKSTGG